MSSRAPVSALSLLQSSASQPRLSFGCEILDSLFGRGLAPGVYEITGEAGSGKTQLAMQLMLIARLPCDLGGLSSASIFLNSESDFPIDRLHQLAEHWEKRYSWIEMKRNDFLDRIYIENVKSLDSLIRLLFDRLPSLLQRSQAKLVVLDSIAAIFRGEDSTATGSDPSSSSTASRVHQLSYRSEEFFSISAHLKKLVAQHQIIVLILNQVTDVIEKSDYSGAPALYCDAFSDRSGLGIAVKSSGRRVAPALGLAWANCIETRIFLTRTRNNSPAPNSILSGASVYDDGDRVVKSENGAARVKTERVKKEDQQEEEEGEDSDEKEQKKNSLTRPRVTGAEILRQFLLLFSPSNPRASARFVLDGEGIHGLSSHLVDDREPPKTSAAFSLPSASYSSRLTASSPSFATPHLSVAKPDVSSPSPFPGSTSLWLYPEQL